MHRRSFLTLAGVSLSAASLPLLGCNAKPPSGGSPRPAGSPALVPVASAAPRSYGTVLLADVPHVRQKPDFCGEAVTESWLRHLGSNVTQDQVFNVSGMDPARGMGLTTRELRTALGNLGFETGPVWHQVSADSAEGQLEAMFQELHADLKRGVPSIVCTRFDESANASEHFRLVLGYDQSADEVVYHDPALDRGGYLRMSRARLKSLWPLKYESDRWTVIRLRLERKHEVAPPRPEGFSAADYAQHVMKISRHIPRGFHVVVEPPFVVVGDGGASAVQRRAEGTVRWAVERLQRAFFPKQPRRILTVWLFDGKQSYQTHNARIWGSVPDTPYGYYSPSNDALVMNIATGGGTLVHEIVHPFMEANFPSCPAWINEGLGSLYEQSADRGGDIVGLTNWRLAGLQSAIRKKRVPSFKTLTATSEHQFYNQDPGTNYSQSRYLMYYLQEKGLLRSFYHRALSERREDPTGYRALKRVLGDPDMREFQQRWQKWVLTLRFPG